MTAALKGGMQHGTSTAASSSPALPTIQKTVSQRSNDRKQDTALCSSPHQQTFDAGRADAPYPEPTESTRLLDGSGDKVHMGDDSVMRRGRDEENGTLVDEPMEEDDHIPKGVFSIIALLLAGTLIASFDATMVIATTGTIASSFGAFTGAEWINTSYALLATSAQPILGKLSDILGRRPILLVCYCAFAVGTFGIGLSTSMPQVILGRAITGLGGGGMILTATIIVTDLVPLRQIASIRSYISVIQTLGRVMGAPLGGILADKIGWRWEVLICLTPEVMVKTLTSSRSFTGQSPFIFLAISLVAFRLPSTTRSSSTPDALRPSKRALLSRVDFLGAFLLFLSLIAFLGAFALGGQALVWSDYRVISLLVGSVFLLALFTLYELYCVVEPIFPPQLAIRRGVLTANALNLLLNFSQLSMMLTIPTYFLVTSHASVTSAAVHILPISIANVLGGLLSGYIIRRTGRYKLLLVGGSALAVTSYVLLVMTWRGHTNLLQSLYVCPTGIGASMVYTSSFIALTASVEKEELAMAAGSAYVSTGIGIVTGISVTSSVQHSSLKWILDGKIKGDRKAEIIEGVISDLKNVWKLKNPMKQTVVDAYVKSLEYSHLVSLSAAVLALLISLTVREKKLT